MNGNVLITGGAGFIGRHTAEELVQNGFDIVIADKKRKKPDINYKYYQIDVATDDLGIVFKENKIDYVIHLAALPSVADSIKNPMIDCHDNYQATVNVCNYSLNNNIKKIIFSSTAALYAHPKYLPVDEKHPVSFLSPYAITKNASECFIKYSKLNYIIFRYANVYGEGQDSTGEAGVVAKFFDNMKNSLPVSIHGNGEQYRDFIYVKDVARANLLAVQKDIKNETVNVSTNKKTSVNELFETLKKTLNYPLSPNYTESRAGDIEKSVLSNEKLISLFNFVPSIGIQEGIEKMAKSSKNVFSLQ